MSPVGWQNHYVQFLRDTQASKRCRYPAPYLCGEAGTRRERRYGGSTGGYLGRAGFESWGVLRAVYKGGAAEDTEASGLSERMTLSKSGGGLTGSGPG